MYEEYLHSLTTLLSCAVDFLVKHVSTLKLLKNTLG